jgi:hypothetical protein
MRLEALLGVSVLGVAIGFLACAGTDSSSGDGGSGNAGLTNTGTTTTTGSSTTTGSGNTGGTGNTGGGGGTAASGGGGQGGQASQECAEQTSSITGECDLYKQNCPVGKMCAVTGGTGGGNPAAATCVNAQNGLKDRGMDCQAETECMNGMLCLDNHCTPFCCPATDQPCGSGTCDVHVTFAENIATWAMMCGYSQSCVLFAHQCTSPDECHIAQAEQGISVCDAPAGSHVDEGGVCTYRNDCGDDQMCNRNGADDGGATGKCRYNCNTTLTQQPAGSGGCPGGQQCNNMNIEAMPNIGVCMLP